MKFYFYFLFASASLIADLPLLKTDGTSVYVVSTFEEVDYFSCLNPDGKFLWEIPFAAKIKDWKIQNDLLFIQSADRKKPIKYLSCFNLENGEFKWEKPIFSPSLVPDQVDIDKATEE